MPKKPVSEAKLSEGAVVTRLLTVRVASFTPEDVINGKCQDCSQFVEYFTRLLKRFTPVTRLIEASEGQPEVFMDKSKPAVATYQCVWEEGCEPFPPAHIEITMPLYTPYLPPLPCKFRSSSIALDEVSSSDLINGLPKHLSWTTQPDVQFFDNGESYFCGEKPDFKKSTFETTAHELKGVNCEPATAAAEEVQTLITRYLPQLYSSTGEVTLLFGIHDDGWVQGMPSGTFKELKEAPLLRFPEKIFPFAGDMKATVTLHPVEACQVTATEKANQMRRFEGFKDNKGTLRETGKTKAKHYQLKNPSWRCLKDPSVLLLPTDPLETITNTTRITPEEASDLWADMEPMREVVAVKLEFAAGPRPSYTRCYPLHEPMAYAAIVNGWATKHHSAHRDLAHEAIRRSTGLLFTASSESTLESFTTITPDMNVHDQIETVQEHIETHHESFSTQRTVLQIVVDIPSCLFSNGSSQLTDMGDCLLDTLNYASKKKLQVRCMLLFANSGVLAGSLRSLQAMKKHLKCFTLFAFSLADLQRREQPGESGIDEGQLSNSECALLLGRASFTELGTKCAPSAEEQHEAARIYLNSQNAPQSGWIFDPSHGVVVRRRFTDYTKATLHEELSMTTLKTMRVVSGGKETPLDGSTTSLAIAITELVHDLRRQDFNAIGFLNLEPPGSRAMADSSPVCSSSAAKTTTDGAGWLQRFIDSIPVRYEVVFITISRRSTFDAEGKSVQLKGSNNEKRRVVIVTDFVENEVPTSAALPNAHGQLFDTENSDIRNCFSRWGSTAHAHSLDQLAVYATEHRRCWLAMWPITAFRNDFMPLDEIIHSVCEGLVVDSPAWNFLLLATALQAFIPGFHWPLRRCGDRVKGVSSVRASEDVHKVWKATFGERERETLRGILDDSSLLFRHPYIAWRVFCDAASKLSSHNAVVTQLINTAKHVTFDFNAEKTMACLLLSHTAIRSDLQLAIPPLYLSLKESSTPDGICSTTIAELKGLLTVIRPSGFFAGMKRGVKLCMARIENIWAEVLLEEHLALDSEEELWDALAHCKNALTEVDTLLVEEPEYSEAHHHRSIVLATLRLCELALKIDPVSTETHVLLNEARSKLGSLPTTNQKLDLHRQSRENERCRDVESKKHLEKWFCDLLTTTTWKSILWGRWESLFES